MIIKVAICSIRLQKSLNWEIEKFKVQKKWQLIIENPAPELIGFSSIQ